MGCAGNRYVSTPTVDWLAANGTQFTQASSACPVCVPARKTLMTGLSPRTLEDRTFRTTQPLPEVPTLAQCFRDAGYQAYAVGKLHTHPQRNRIGFDDVLLNEEGRHQGTMTADDWELYLAEQGFAGRAYAAGASNNCYHVTPWHLPDECHQTNWTAREMCRMIRRRDPRKPGFWYLSFAAPHPPLWPLRSYLEQYLQLEVDTPARGAWVEEIMEHLPAKLAASCRRDTFLSDAPPDRVALIRRAFYAAITHIDHQIRVVLGTLREEGLLENTVVAFTSDHGEMLGDHGLWAKSLFYEPSCRVPFIVMPSRQDAGAKRGVRDDRLVELRDMMPTLLEMAGIDVPSHVEGGPVFTAPRRATLYGEHGEGIAATRMLRDERHKLIYYPEGNRFQLFDLAEDPQECLDRIADPAYAQVAARLKEQLAGELYGEDVEWICNGEWVGLPLAEKAPGLSPDLWGQRGIHFM